MNAPHIFFLHGICQGISNCLFFNLLLLFRSGETGNNGQWKGYGETSPSGIICFLILNLHIHYTSFATRQTNTLQEKRKEKLV
ncbi:hypothetical protein F5Y04DRAFT_243607 [Hypomontagnella monticulosa]|nr:hypothetical protein F5Y04DRAFT_243607 [Hypomontagnella monticulosa]